VMKRGVQSKRTFSARNHCFFLQFMKRTKERQDIEDENEESRSLYRDKISEAMRTQG